MRINTYKCGIHKFEHLKNIIYCMELMFKFNLE